MPGPGRWCRLPTTAAIKVIEANALLDAAAAEADALLVLARAEAEAEATRANQRTDEFHARLEAVSRLIQRMDVKPDAAWRGCASSNVGSNVLARRCCPKASQCRRCGAGSLFSPQTQLARHRVIAVQYLWK